MNMLDYESTNQKVATLATLATQVWGNPSEKCSSCMIAERTARIGRYASTLPMGGMIFGYDETIAVIRKNAESIGLVCTVTSTGDVLVGRPDVSVRMHSSAPPGGLDERK